MNKEWVYSQLEDEESKKIYIIKKLLSMIVEIILILRILRHNIYQSSLIRYIILEKR